MEIRTYLIATILFLSCKEKPAETLSSDSIQPVNLFTLSDAEKILGEPAHLTDSSSRVIVDTTDYRCAYTALSEDEKTGKTGNIYFLYEEFTNDQIAKELYSFIKKGNENHEGVVVRHDLGDEAYFHSDGKNFYFILVRKGKRMMRMKVNKITSKTSVTEFNSIAKNIATVM